MDGNVNVGLERIAMRGSVNGGYQGKGRIVIFPIDYAGKVFVEGELITLTREQLEKLYRVPRVFQGMLAEAYRTGQGNQIIPMVFKKGDLESSETIRQNSIIPLD